MGTPADVSDPRCVVIGGGPAGLTAAYELARLGVPAVVLEQDEMVGGIARTGSYKGFRYDIGGHRFFTKVPLVQQIWEEVLGEELLVRPRLSRIYYDDKFFDYPLRPMNALIGLGPIEAARIGFSYLAAQLRPAREEKNFEQWVSNRFGRRLFELFFKTYTEKVWGIPCSEIGADWAAQRIKNLDLVAAVKNALLGAKGGKGGEVVTTLIESFHYPRLGPGQMWDRCRDLLEAKGYLTLLGRKVVRVRHARGRVTELVVRRRDGSEESFAGSHFLSSMPIRSLLRAFDPPPPPSVLAAAERLRYRDFLTVVLIVDRAELFPDNWIYIHSAKVKLGRIQNFKNWSPDMVPDPGKTGLGLEYFVQKDDELWAAPDAELVALGRRECALLGLVREEEVSDGTVVRMPKAYPVYDGDYQGALAEIRSWLEGFPNLQLMGRNGLHRYNNQDHSMLTAVYAARNLVGGSHDIWNVNVDQEYHEEVRRPQDGLQEKRPERTGERMVPQRVAAAPALVARAVDEDLIRSVFARYDPVALGGAVGLLGGLTLFLATVKLLLGPEPHGPSLSLLGNYLIGFRASWGGAFIGLAEAGLFGFGFGAVLASLINAVVALEEQSLRRQIEMRNALDLLDEEPP